MISRKFGEQLKRVVFCYHLKTVSTRKKPIQISNMGIKKLKIVKKVNGKKVKTSIKLRVNV